MDKTCAARLDPTAPEPSTPVPGTPPLAAVELSRLLSGKRVLDRVDLEVWPGECMALRGDNGAGKTTLLRCLAGRLRPSSGAVLWHGVSPRQRTDLHAQIGFAAHDTGVYAELTVQENLRFAARMYPLPDVESRIAALLEATGLALRRHQLAGRLSQGLRHRLALARALIHDPPIVLLDEPFANLDAAGCRWLFDWLLELKTRRRAIVFSTHDEPSSARLADRQGVLSGGRLALRANAPVSTWPRSA